MMRFLSLLLVVQIAAVAAFYWPRDTGPTTQSALIATLAEADIRRIEITESDSDGGESRVQLNRAEEGWQLDSGLPVDTSKVDVVLRALLSADPGFAIANSASAAKRFEVADDIFSRRIVLASDASEQTAYLGTSPSFRKVHARRDDDASVYVLELNSYDAPADVDGWLDRKLLAQRDLSRVAFDGAVFTLDADTWARAYEAGAADDAPGVDGDAMETLVQALAGLQVNGITDGEDSDDLADARVALDAELSSDDGATTQLSVLHNAEENRYFLRSDTYDAVFNTSAYDAERLIEAANTLLGKDESVADDVGIESASPEETTSQSDADIGSNSDVGADPATESESDR